MTKMMFVNLPVNDLAAATRFYEAIGCRKNPQFSDANASSMAWSDTIIFQLLTRDFYKTFTSKPIADAHATSAMMIALSCESREEVDATLKIAAVSGGTADTREKMDLGWMYNRAVADPDGNVLELIWMDMDRMPKRPADSTR
jgi:uncharacterized protein